MDIINASIRLSWRSGGFREGREASLTVTDQNSGYRVFEALLTAEDVANMLASASADVKAEIVSRALFENVGKQIKNKLIEFPETIGRRFEDKEETEAMQVFAKNYIDEHGWHHYRWNRTNSGWQLIGFWFEERVDEED